MSENICNECIFCDDERNGYHEKLHPIYYQENEIFGRIEDIFYCKIHGIIIEDLGGNMRLITLRGKGN